jgi:hypothetical protein
MQGVGNKTYPYFANIEKSWGLHVQQIEQTGQSIYLILNMVLKTPLLLKLTKTWLSPGLQVNSNEDGCYNLSIYTHQRFCEWSYNGKQKTVKPPVLTQVWANHVSRMEGVDNDPSFLPHFCKFQSKEDITQFRIVVGHHGPEMCCRCWWQCCLAKRSTTQICKPAKVTISLTVGEPEE